MLKPSFPTSRAPLDSFLNVTQFPSGLARFAKYEFDKHLYYYGAHFAGGYDRRVNGRNEDEYQAELLQLCAKLQPVIEAELSAKRRPATATPCVFSSAYFGWERALAQNGVRLVRPPWLGAEADNTLSAALFNQCRAINELFRSGLSVFYRADFHDALRASVGNLEQYYALHPARGVLLPFTLGFFEGVTSDILRRLGKPVFLCIHGLPGRFDWWERGEHPVDYIVVWGDAMRRRIEATGRPADTVLVSGHPDYSGRALRPITSKLDRVLVLGFAQNGAPPLEVPHYHDRSLALDYAWRIQGCLRNAGVTRARIRPHPSESTAWYRAHLDAAFWTVDESRTCADALAASSLVIGPTSTVALDAVVAGINYLGFWPSLRHYNPAALWYYDPDIPLDGSDPRFPVATTESELVDLLKQGAQVDGAALADYIAPAFRPEVVIAKLNLPASSVGRPILDVTTAALADPASGNVAEAIPEATAVPVSTWETNVLQTIRPYTMTPPPVTLNALRAVEYVEKKKVPGAIVECGVWRGGVSMAMILQLKRHDSKRPVFMYDTFDGMSEPTEDDVSPSGESAIKLLAEHKKDEGNHFWAFAPFERVKRNITAVGYPMDRVRMVKGKVEDTIPGVIPEQIAVLRLDTDWYESTRHELLHLYSRLVPGGILILDDYGFWQGARKAVDEFFATLSRKPELHVVHDQFNSCVRWAIKP